MAIAPEDEYPGQVDTSDGNYQYGKARNDSAPDSGDGSPLEQAWVNDLWGFLQGLLRNANVTPSGTPDFAPAAPSEANAQYLHALRTLLRGRSIVLDVLSPGAVPHDAKFLLSTRRASYGDAWNVVDLVGGYPVGTGHLVKIDDISSEPWGSHFLATLWVNLRCSGTSNPWKISVEMGLSAGSPITASVFRYSASTAQAMLLVASDVVLFNDNGFYLKNTSGADVTPVISSGTRAGILTLTQVPGALWA